MSLDSNMKSQIEDDIETLNQLLSLNPFETISDTYVQKAVFTKIMIDLADLVRKCEKLKVPITFTDDVNINNQLKILNASNLITYVRDALCHIDSFKHYYNSDIVLSYIVLYGKCPDAIGINGSTIGSDYEDDICIIFGSQKIYYKRHILRVFKESKNNLSPFLK